MMDINQLEKYIEQKRRIGKRGLKVVFLILFLILSLGILAVLFWRYGLEDTQPAGTNNEKTNVSSEISPKKEPSVNLKPAKETIAENTETEREKPTPSPSTSTYVSSSLPSLLIKGEFVSGKPLSFIIENPNGERHDIDFGDGNNKAIKNRTQYVYHEVGEYQVIFKTKNSDKVLMETLFIQEAGENGIHQRFVSFVHSKEKNEDKKAFISSKLDKKASFPGGTSALMAYLQTHIGNVSGYRGRVLITFNINAKGQIDSPKIIEGLNQKLNREILKAFEGMPNWYPAQKKGRSVSSEYRLPIYFSKDI